MSLEGDTKIPNSSICLLQIPILLGLHELENRGGQLNIAVLVFVRVPLQAEELKGFFPRGDVFVHRLLKLIADFGLDSRRLLCLLQAGGVYDKRLRSLRLLFWRGLLPSLLPRLLLCRPRKFRRRGLLLLAAGWRADSGASALRGRIPACLPRLVVHPEGAPGGRINLLDPASRGEALLGEVPPPSAAGRRLGAREALRVRGDVLRLLGSLVSKAWRRTRRGRRCYVLRISPRRMAQAPTRHRGRRRRGPISTSLLVGLAVGPGSTGSTAPAPSLLAPGVLLRSGRVGHTFNGRSGSDLSGRVAPARTVFAVPGAEEALDVEAPGVERAAPTAQDGHCDAQIQGHRLAFLLRRCNSGVRRSGARLRDASCRPAWRGKNEGVSSPRISSTVHHNPSGHLQSKDGLGRQSRIHRDLHLLGPGHRVPGVDSDLPSVHVDVRELGPGLGRLQERQLALRGRGRDAHLFVKC
mmetsp:Transcript_50167/g.142237  ORF Transcript_50167/g.142237 Transcript_50167/m.142237 type:complete len:467 (+) Transcript_50167:40-1440(+)